MGKKKDKAKAKKAKDEQSKKLAKAERKAQEKPEKKARDKAKRKAKAADKAKAKAKASDKAKAKSKSRDKADAKAKDSGRSLTEVLRVGPEFSLAKLDPASTPGFSGDEDDATPLMESMQEAIGELQERLYAEGKAGGARSFLLVIQGMDTSGKGGIMRHVVGAFDPQGVDLTSFKAPTSQERAHPFLWRIRNALPTAGRIGVFDRSQYEDVLIVRVHDLVPRAQWARRYGQINAFERTVAAGGTTIVKVMLHISKDEQKARLGERLDRPDKYWKFNPGDIDERGHWAAYQEAYEAALTKCSTEDAPWFVVPADNKWYARYAVTRLVLEALQGMDPQWPAATFYVAEQQKRLAESE